MRSSVSAGYLSSLTISHITQAIQLTYNSDIQNYLNYLKTITPASNFNYQAELAQIQFIHGECALAPANGTLSNAVSQTSPAPPTIPSPFVYPVVTGKTAIKDLVPDFIGKLDTSPFLAAGVFAVPTPQVGQIKLQVTTGLTLTIKANAIANSHLSIDYTSPPILMISGPASVGDTITVTATPAKPAAPTQGPPSP